MIEKCVQLRDDGAARDKGYDTCVCLVDVDQHASLREALALAAQEGFYVDRDGQGRVSAPADVVAGSIATDLQTAAQVIEMLLIKDHTRMKHDESTPYDSTHEQQHRLLPISHPEDWAAAPEWFRASGGRLPRDE
ncbi:hypothetical protein [Nigerium massiliense]|uniref:hypothetical protein n=1 Tax=Nigerium massiliense TaxID=1522317 RepID=UPI0006936708|nr:hypothetical protein [Nigerium massiliense]